jgi:hypothetical protein
MTRDIDVTVTYGHKIYDVVVNYYFGHPGSWEEPPDGPSIEGLTFNTKSVDMEEETRLWNSEAFMSLVENEVEKVIHSYAEKAYDEYEGELI